ncbi:MAG: hypothetical protein HC833_20785 [Leptolyngbyaceae cyanobacterium RM1_406_9]|nr:hypothetical protein [Leptolyngbyaceae cyanobacterium RM1_406_9]
MIDPIILWVGGIVILLACVMFYLLIAELFKQQQPQPVPRLTPRIRNQATRTRFHNVGSQVIFTKPQTPQKIATAPPTPIASIPPTAPPTPIAPPTSNPSYSRRVSVSVESRLYRLLHGDRAGAVRLIGSIRARNPDKSEQWCWDKAIFDLERDRH